MSQKHPRLKWAILVPVVAANLMTTVGLVNAAQNAPPPRLSCPITALALQTPGKPRLTFEPSPEEPSQTGQDNAGSGKPGLLNRPLESPPPESSPLSQPSVPAFSSGNYFAAPVDAPLGYTGKSSVLSGEIQQHPHFVPRPDRLGAWDFRNGIVMA